jgi:hypothetical protein
MSLPLNAPSKTNGKAATDSWENRLNFAVLLAGIYLIVAQLPEVQAIIPPTFAPYILAITAVVNMLLRTYRTQTKITSLLP